MTALDKSTAELVARLGDIKNRITDLEEQAEAIKAKLRVALPVGNYTVNGQKTLIVGVTRRFKTSLAARILSPELVELCTISRIDSARAKKVLPPALYEQCMEEVGDPVVRLA